MLGRVATAPEGDEEFGGLWPGRFGGNMDASDVREGTTVYLPVFHRGALFYFGDGHALQGDGEVCGSGLETSMEVTFRFDLIKGQRIQWPRLEDADHIMVTAAPGPSRTRCVSRSSSLSTGSSPITASQNPTPTSLHPRSPPSASRTWSTLSTPSWPSFRRNIYRRDRNAGLVSKGSSLG